MVFSEFLQSHILHLKSNKLVKLDTQHVQKIIIRKKLKPLSLV